MASSPYRWSPITDLPRDWQSLAHPELAALTQVWREQKQRLHDPRTLAIFSEQLVREFAIETGILERLYTLDRGITVLLIEQGIHAALIPHEATNRDPDHVAALIRDQASAVEGIFDFVKQERALSTSYIKDLHALLTRHQDSTTAIDSLGRRVEMELLRGEWKAQPNSPLREDGMIHEYCPPEHVAAEMDRLIELHLQHQGAHVAPEVEASWLHHRFTQIHPFQDGNGRVARCLSSLVLIRAEWFPLVIDRGQGAPYIKTLECADHGSLVELVQLVAAAEKRALVRALSLSGAIERQARVSQVIKATRHDLEQRRHDAIREAWEKVKATAARAHAVAATRLGEVAAEINIELHPLRPDLRARVFSNTAEGPRGAWFQYQVVETAKRLHYFANKSEYHAWLRLVLKVDVQSEILVSFHGLGRDNTGVIAVSACLFRKGSEDEGSSQVTDLEPLTDEVFQLNYIEPTERALERFSIWLEQILIRGLDLWRRGL